MKLKNKKHKHPSDSSIIKTEVVCPIDTNPLGMLKGGRLVEWMDMAAAGCAQIHSGNTCVTAAINHVDFLQAAKSGDIISIRAFVTRVFHSSMEVFVQSFAQNLKGLKKNLICEAYFTFVALDDEGRAIETIAIKPVTEKEKRKFEEALVRKKNISEIKKRIKNEQYEWGNSKVY